MRAGVRPSGVDCEWRAWLQQVDFASPSHAAKMTSDALRVFARDSLQIDVPPHVVFQHCASSFPLL
jgi:hypothetical protein